MALPVRELTLAEAITFTRASKAWYFNNLGVFSEAAVDAIREDHDPGDSNARQGICAIEGASTNLLTYSEDLSNAVWDKVGTTIGTAISFATNISLDELVETTANSPHVVFQSKTVSANGKVTGACLLKRKGTDRQYGYLKMAARDSAGDVGRYSVLVDLDDGSVLDTDTSGSASVTSGATNNVVPLGGGVYRVEATVTTDITTNATATV